MRRLASILLAFATASLFAGCASVERTLNNLPQVSAAELHIATSGALGGLQVDAVNLLQTPAKATADQLTIQVSTPWIGTTTVSIKGYEREKRVASLDPH